MWESINLTLFGHLVFDLLKQIPFDTNTLQAFLVLWTQNRKGKNNRCIFDSRTLDLLIMLVLKPFSFCITLKKVFLCIMS